MDAKAPARAPVVVAVQLTQECGGPAQDPGQQDVGVGVVANAGSGLPRVAVVELVGPHDAVDVVAVGRRVVGRHAGEAANDLNDQLHADLGQVDPVVTRLDVLNRCCRRWPDPRAVAGGSCRASRNRTDVEELAGRLVAAVAAALPRKQRSGQPSGVCRGLRLAEPPVPVQQDRAGQRPAAAG